jgi:hypothetical protein
MKELSNSRKVIPTNYEASGIRMISIGLMVRKLRSKQSSNVATEKVWQTCLALDRICPVSSDISNKSIGYVRSTQKLSSQL